MTDTQYDPAQAGTLAPGDAAQIRRAFGAMPYLPLTHRPPVETVDDVVTTLDALAEVLRKVGEAHEIDGRELRELRAQRAAVRAFLGRS